VPSYLVETYLSSRDSPQRAARVERARSAAEHMTQRGICVRLDRFFHVPEDEMCFFVFHAPSRGDALHAARYAELDPLRVVEAVTSGEE
jgi:hypothetical protein